MYRRQHSFDNFIPKNVEQTDTGHSSTPDTAERFRRSLYPPRHSAGYRPTFVTEAGRRIRGDHWSLYRDELPEASLSEITQWLQEEGLAGKVRIVGPSNREFNCHSYTFTHGRAGWIGHEQVEGILRDQQYIRCSRQGAQVGDIVMYWNAEGHIKHSGVISKREGHTFSVISKWGDLSLMEHGIDDVPSRFGPHKAVYHSELVETPLLTDAY